MTDLWITSILTGEDLGRLETKVSRYLFGNQCTKVLNVSSGRSVNDQAC